MAKKNSRLEALAQEAAEQEPIPNAGDASEGEGAAVAAPSPAADTFAGPNPVMVKFCKMPVMMIGGALCGGSGVTPLTAIEVEEISAALADVLDACGITIKDRRLATAIALGGAVAQVAVPRVMQYRDQQAAAREAIEAARRAPVEPAVDAQAA